MTLSKSTRVERILIVLNADGTVKGAHQESLTTVMDGDTVVSTRQEAAAPLTAESLAVVLPTQAPLLAQVQGLTDRVTALTAERDTALAAKTEAEQQRDAAQTQIAALQSANATVDAGGVAILTPVQVRLALLQSGISTSQVLAVIDAIPDPVQRETALTYWDYSLNYHRDHPLIATLGTALGLASEQIDALWTAAAQIG